MVPVDATWVGPTLVSPYGSSNRPTGLVNNNPIKMSLAWDFNCSSPPLPPSSDGHFLLPFLHDTWLDKKELLMDCILIKIKLINKFYMPIILFFFLLGETFTYTTIHSAQVPVSTSMARNWSRLIQGKRGVPYLWSISELTVLHGNHNHLMRSLQVNNIVQFMFNY